MSDKHRLALSDPGAVQQWDSTDPRDWRYYIPTRIQLAWRVLSPTERAIAFIMSNARALSTGETSS
jgi:hypothetical protein